MWHKGSVEAEYRPSFRRNVAIIGSRSDSLSTVCGASLIHSNLPGNLPFAVRNVIRTLFTVL